MRGDRDMFKIIVM